MIESDPAGTRRIRRQERLSGEVREADDTVVAEVPVALVYNGVSHVVMMATPRDLEDFALGFSLSERIVARPAQLLGVELKDHALGLELHIDIVSEAFVALKERRRNLAGRTGCGLCGAESLEQAIPPPALVTTDLLLPAASVSRALEAMQAQQTLRAATGAVHGAAFCSPQGEVLILREDVGRHNALDKVLGALVRESYAPAGFLLVSSRASYEMVAKAASANIPVLAAVSAATSLAIEQAETAGITLLGLVQGSRQLVYTHPQRIAGER